MSSYDYNPDEPTGAAEAADFAAWRNQRDAEAEAKQPRPIDWETDPRTAASAAAKATIEAGGTEEQALGASFATLVAAARASDPRVRVDLQGPPGR